MRPTSLMVILLKPAPRTGCSPFSMWTISLSGPDPTTILAALEQVTGLVPQGTFFTVMEKLSIPVICPLARMYSQLPLKSKILPSKVL